LSPVLSASGRNWPWNPGWTPETVLLFLDWLEVGALQVGELASFDVFRLAGHGSLARLT